MQQPAAAATSGGNLIQKLIVGGAMFGGKSNFRGTTSSFGVSSELFTPYIYVLGVDGSQDLVSTPN